MTTRKKISKLLSSGTQFFWAENLSIVFDSQVAKVLEAHSDLGDVDVEVCNLSVNGRTTRQALEDMPYSIQTQSVSILLIQFGLNDCNYWETDLGVPRVSLEAYLANISEMITRAQKCAIQRLLYPTITQRPVSPTKYHTDMTFENSNKVYVYIGGIDDAQTYSAVFVNTRKCFCRR